MIEKILLDYLTQELEVPVYMEVPEEMPESFVGMEKTGSGRKNLIDRATIAVQSYGPTLYDAAQLNEGVKAVMDDAIGLTGVSASRLNSDYNYTDQSVKKYRYQAVYDVYYHI